MKSNKKFFLMQSIVLIYSLVGVLSKISSNKMQKYGLFSIEFFTSIFAMLLILGVYAIFWQIILKKTNLGTAYANKAIGLLWTLIWAILFFGEKIYIQNIIGIILIISGIRMVNMNED